MENRRVRPTTAISALSATTLFFVFNQFGDCEGAMLRPGNVHSAHDWRHVLEPILARYERTGVRRYFKFYNARRPHSSLGGMTPDQFFARAPAESAAA